MAEFNSLTEEGKLQKRKKEIITEIQEKVASAKSLLERKRLNWIQQLEEVGSTINTFRSLKEKEASFKQALIILEEMNRSLQQTLESVSKLKRRIVDLEDVAIKLEQLEEDKTQFKCFVRVYPGEKTTTLFFQNKSLILGRETLPDLPLAFSKSHLRIIFLGNDTFECELLSTSQTLVVTKDYSSLSADFYDNFALRKGQKMKVVLGQEVFVRLAEIKNQEIKKRYKLSFKVVFPG